MVFRITQHVEHHHRVGHGGKDGAQAMLSVQPFADKGHGLLDSALPRGLRKQWFSRAKDGVDRLEQQEPAPGLVRSLGAASRSLGRIEKQLVYSHAARVAGFGLQRLEY